MTCFKMLNVQKMILPSENSFCSVFDGHNIILFKDGDSYRFPEIKELNLSEPVEMLRVGEIGDNDCYAFEMEFKLLPECCESIDFRQALKLMNAHDVAASNRARQMLYWNNEHKFCGHCGKLTELSKVETAKICPSCKAHFYPRIMPAVIVSITKGDELLLAHNVKFRDGLYSLIAGFVEAGESLEEAVAREIYEEIHIKVKNIKYFESQSWPFPQSLMLGFTAEHESGKIIEDGEEIADAKWFKIDNMPLLPSKGSISRKLIDSFIESRKNIIS
jgi:NAD+ diphosphatase